MGNGQLLRLVPIPRRYVVYHIAYVVHVGHHCAVHQVPLGLMVVGISGLDHMLGKYVAHRHHQKWHHECVMHVPLRIPEKPPLFLHPGSSPGSRHRPLVAQTPGTLRKGKNLPITCLTLTYLYYYYYCCYYYYHHHHYYHYYYYYYHYYHIYYYYYYYYYYCCVIIFIV